MAEILAALRSLMSSHDPPLHALVVPSEDYHQSEYVSARDKRREFVSVSPEVPATQELTGEWKLMRMLEDPAVDVWMANNLPNDAAIGVDPWCVSIDTAQRWERAFAKKQQKLVQTSTNMVDKVWKNRPPAETYPVTVQQIEFAGSSVVEKLKDLREKLTNEKARGIIITTLDEVAWLYNIRGTDVPYCPVVHAFAIVTTNAAFLYVDKRKVSSEVISFLKESGVEVRDYDAVSSDVVLLQSNQLNPPADVQGSDLIWADPNSCSYALYSKLNSDKVLLQQSPLALAKAIKNPVELDGLKKAHIRDGAAIVQYIVWLDKQMQEIYGASGYFLEGEATKEKKHSGTVKLTEVTVSDKLESFRASKEHFRGLSFPTISSVGPNAAIMHYSPQSETCAEMDPNSIYLCDSGAQYQDGTTDITRTFHFGKPSAHEKACYTAVLKGHIALGNAVFPNGTCGHTLDILARLPLWKYGLDYRHGTGHGVGSYLNVHEGPQSISFKPRNVPIHASMTATDEPGYYEDGNFGIRLENVLVVTDANTKFNFGDKGYLSFEHITWAPYQIKMINLKSLTPEEIDWLNAYHSRCRDILAPYLDETELAWLKKATEPASA